MELELSPGESHSYLEYYTPNNWFTQDKAGGINNEKSNLLFDSGAEVSIIDITFSRRKVGCVIDES